MPVFFSQRGGLCKTFADGARKVVKSWLVKFPSTHQCLGHALRGCVVRLRT